MERPEAFIAREGVRAAVSRDRFSVAGIIFTYQCSIACRHCLFACRPKRPRVVMDTDDCVRYIEFYYTQPRVIHMAGGDCFLYYRNMLEVCREAQRQGTPVHFVESNSAFCTNDDLVRRRFTELRDAGVMGMFLSADVFHQEFVPAERVLRARRIATEVWGEANVLGSALSTQDPTEFEGIARDESALREHVRSRGAGRATGNSFKYLAQYLDRQPVDAFGQARCRESFDLDRMWEYHLDPYGNVQTNCGIVLGNAQRESLGEIFDQSRVWANPIVKTVSEDGPVALLHEAVERGLEARDGYVQKCELCFHARRFLRPHYPDILCPDEVYDI